MHRSGTSLAASLLSSAGVSMGERLMEANPANPEGFFEDLDFVDFHRMALAERDLHPDGWDPGAIDSVDNVLAFKARSLVASKATQKSWGFKDPRTVLFLSYWARLLPQARFVFLFRTPWDVVDSLFRTRDTAVIDRPQRAADIWYAYNRQILDFVEHNPDRSILFDADGVARDPAGFIRAIAERFGARLSPPDTRLFRPDLYGRDGGGASRAAVFSRLHAREMRLLAALVRRAHPLAGGAPGRAPQRPSVEAASNAFLAEWATSRSRVNAAAGVKAEAPQPVSVPPAPSHPISVQAFAPRVGAYSDAQSITLHVQDNGEAKELAFFLPFDASAPVRIDVGDPSHVVEIRRITARLVGGSGVTEVHTWSGEALSRAPLRLEGCVRVGGEGEGVLRYVALHNDPQLFLDLQPKLAPPVECRLELTVAVCNGLAHSRLPQLWGWFSLLSRELASSHESRRLSESHAATVSAQLAEARAQLSDTEQRLTDDAAHEIGRLRDQLAAAEEVRRGFEGELTRAITEQAETWEQAEHARTEMARLKTEMVRLTEEQAVALAEAKQAGADDLQRQRELLTGELRHLKQQLLVEQAARKGLLETLKQRTRTLAAAEGQTAKFSRQPLARAGRRMAASLLLLGHPEHGLLAGSASKRHNLRKIFRVATTHRQASIIERSELFDETCYRTGNTDLGEPGIDAPRHYLLFGAAEGRDPHPLFDTRYYLDCNSDVAASGVNPLVHYLLIGDSEGRNPHPLFDAPHYKAGLGSDEAPTNLLVHFLRVGAFAGRDPSPLFDTSFYLETYPDVAASGVNPLVHFLAHGASEGRDPSPLFDTSFYIERYPDVVTSGMNPLVHYLQRGAAEGRLTKRPPSETASPRDIASPAATEQERTDREASHRDYAEVLARARADRASRLEGVIVAPPEMIAFSTGPMLETQIASIRFERQESPEASIIVPAWNHVQLTAECLASIGRFTGDVACEVIVFDNGSTDETPLLLPGIPNVVYRRSSENLGFAIGCDEAAASARGRFLVFLSNDTQVTPGWLARLLAACRSDPSVGAVGPKVLFPDGRLQEAGSSINADCSTTAIGAFDHPDVPAFNRAREVDYISGVCLAIRADRFRESGGFDPAFAHCHEDVDLCLRLRSRGLKILYEPESVIIHHSDARSGARAADVKVQVLMRHEQKLAERHQEQIDELNKVRLLAFYLPQFHPIPENDRWWGRGFTEWRNVARGRPNFTDHYQPRLPADLGFYDLRLRETYLQQIELAEQYGVHGFCMYYYWFAGKRLLERPLERLLEDGDLRFPFCLTWANENWTRTWDGSENDILLAQAHGDDDDIAVIRDLMRYFEHPSYIRIRGRPLFLVYRIDLFPDIRHTVEIWRDECRRSGLGEIYLATVESFPQTRKDASPVSFGFDASVEFPPHNCGGAIAVPEPLLNQSYRGRVYDYKATAQAYMRRRRPGHAAFRTVMPSWDNTARRQDVADVFVGSTPGAYQAWLQWTIRETRRHNFGEERIVFINAWNEWAEANYLEPDVRWGHAYLEATKRALQAAEREP